MCFGVCIWCGAESSRQPIVTGTSVLAIRYKDGVMIAADCLGMSLSAGTLCIGTYGMY